MAISESPGETIGRSGLSAADATVARLSQAMAAGTLTSAELARFYTERIERHNPALGAVISVSADAAEQARAVDQARAAGAELGPLAGVPVLIKDNISVAGSPATAGSPALAGAPAEDAFLIGRLRAANAVILGKANLSEWANFRSTQSSSGWSTLGGQAVNPYGSGRNPSGSSSGSAVAVAAGLAPLAVGTETDGSIVSPAHACGIVGIKPTLGLISRTGIVPISAEQDTAGPMARLVADAAALLGVLAGADQADEATGQAGSQPADYTRFLDPAALAGARIGVWREGSPQAIAAAAALLEDAMGVLRAHGAEIIDQVELAGADKISEPEFLALRHEFKDDLNSYLAALGGDHPRSLAELIQFNTAHADRVLRHFGQQIFEQAEATSGRSDEQWQPAREQARALATSGLDAALAGHRLDAVLALTGNPAWLTDYVLGDHYTIGTSSPAAVSGYPAITVPAGTVGGLPVGVSLIGPAFSEPRLIALAYSFEQARRQQD
ncbi:MAG TPA: amidase [Streptosporangiaceae bacterium]|nr:amidase [Streptosporangiaceae bacterium]